MPTHRTMFTRALGATLLATALLGCSSGDDGDDASADTTEAAADETTTAAPSGDETTTTAVPSDDRSDSDCPLTADEVSGAIGATVVDGDPGQVELLVPDPAIRERADALCMFSADGGFNIPLVVIISSDDAEAEAGARSILQGNDPQPVAGVGDQAFGDGGELIFQRGDTWTGVLVTVTGDPAGDQDAAIALAHLVGG